MNKIDTVIYAFGIGALVCIALYFIYLSILGVCKLVEWISPKIGRRCENCYWYRVKNELKRCERCIRYPQREDMFSRKKRIKRSRGHRSNFAYIDEDAFSKHKNPPEENTSTDEEEKKMHEDMIKFTCEHCKTTVVQPKNKALPFVPTPAYWSRFRVDFYGDKTTSPKECDLCPKCALLFKRLTRSFFGWDVKDLDAEIEKIFNDTSTDEEDDIDRDALKVLEDYIEKYSENRDLYCFIDNTAAIDTAYEEFVRNNERSDENV